MTRAFVCSAHGHFNEAFVWHPLGPLLFLLMVGYLAFSLVLVVRGQTVRVDQRFQLGALGIIAVALVIFWGLRLAGVFPLPS